MTVDSEDGQDDSSESSSEDQQQHAKRRKYNDDEKKVPFVTHATPPEIVKEFMHELKGSWAIFGTSEVGVAGHKGHLFFIIIIFPPLCMLLLIL
jgi:hypothetical protein